MGTLNVVGIGPGAKEHMTILAYETLKESDIIVGYTKYIALLTEEFDGIKKISTGMGSEEERCRMALDEASKDSNVSLICSGDSVIYGMAGLVYELLSDYENVDVKVIPGVTAAISGSSLIGAGIGNDFSVISLSNYLTDKEDTYKRLRACAEADLVIVLYNPVSNKRPDCLSNACDYLMNIIPHDRVCAVAKNIGRENECYEVMTLKELREFKADMFSTVFIGSSNTVCVNNKFVTRRGYKV
ncbi:MAG: precorrin-3B C(17)-methyltransferase [Lachnospiraceae bacterium]|nr:precorrin-3B C(17)-methyltransferase [Lachnospiraceae bacterium]